MRRINGILTAAILVLFIAHAVLGAFQLFGIGSVTLRVLAWILAGLVIVHTLIGFKLTFDTLRAWKKSGVSYFRHNALFWARRLSGYAVMVFLIFHAFAFSYTSSGAYRLYAFDGFRLTTQILLVVTIAVHVITNVKPMLITFGIKNLRAIAGDILLVLSILLLFMAAAFIFYYLRWNVF